MPRVRSQRGALDASGDPVAVDVVPDVPGAGGTVAALVAPYVAFTIHELVDVPLDTLRRGGIGDVEICVIDEVVQSTIFCYVAFEQELLPPQSVRVWRATAEIELSGTAVHGGRRVILRHAENSG